MELLLILSALLSALTGAMSGGRAVPVPLHQSATRSIAVETQPVSAVQATARPVALAATLIAGAKLPSLRPFALTPSAPLYASRRRE